jgi:hypothetical protein
MPKALTTSVANSTVTIDTMDTSVQGPAPRRTQPARAPGAGVDLQSLLGRPSRFGGVPTVDGRGPP